MNEPLLDRLDRDPGGARRFLADLLGQGATNAEAADALRAKFGESVTPRSITTWRNHDPELREMLADLEAIRRNLAAGDDTNPSDLLRPQVNKAQVDDDMLTMSDEHPAFTALLLRRTDGVAAREVANVWGGEATTDAPAALPDIDPDALAVLMAEHDSDEAFEADALGRLTDEERADIEHLLAPL